MKILSTLKEKVLFIIASVRRSFWLIFGRHYFYGYDEPHGSDYGSVVTGYKNSKGEMIITNQEIYETKNNIQTAKNYD